jgi:hypothetical protein
MIGRRSFLKWIGAIFGATTTGFSFQWLNRFLQKKVPVINPEWKMAKYKLSVFGKCPKIETIDHSKGHWGRRCLAYVRGNEISKEGKLITIPWLVFERRPSVISSKEEFFRSHRSSERIPISGEQALRESNPEFCSNPSPRPRITIKIPEIS